ncbi:MAG TPA: patatin-like phospholipase family protein [Symbiobacteriaceae bacterium]|nr:patatin-like phospholipase family protein [Symbiobacteriaceae bacterium]
MARRFRIARIYAAYRSGPEPLKIALVLSGAVALGTFEAGVVRELLHAVAMGAPLTVDIVVGSSAGALVGAIATKSLVTGVPYEPGLLHWTEITLQQLTSAYETPEQARLRAKPVDRGILSSEAVRRVLDEFLVADPVERSFQPAFPAPRVLLALTLTNLDGLPAPPDAPDKEPRFTEAVIFRFTPPSPDKIRLSPYPPAVWRRIARLGRLSGAFPGAFDPDTAPWAERMAIPGLLEEDWENEQRLEELHAQDPTVQPKMRYADGGILDEQPLERAITLLPRVTGGRGEARVETLVYDPRRCLLFIEPDPQATSPEALKAGTPQSWFDTFTRALRLWTLSSSPHSGQKRILAANKRQEQLFHFLADLARRMREDGQSVNVRQAMELFRASRTGAALYGHPMSGGVGEPAGLIDPDLYTQAVHALYRWLTDEERFVRDLEWLDSLPAGRIRDAHTSMRAALLELREAYLSLEGVDPVAPGRYQAVLVEIHAALAESLGLSQPWIALHEVTPEDPRQMLKGEEIIHFGGFFSREFLRHDFEVGRYYAHLWLKQAIPGYDPPEPPQRPPVTEDGVNWRLLWQNRGPLWRMAGRVVAVVLEMAGFSYGGDGQLLVRLLSWSLAFSAVHGLALLTAAWLGWITFPPQYQQFRLWVLLGASLFPLTVGVALGLLVRREVARGINRRDNTR